MIQKNKKYLFCKKDFKYGTRTIFKVDKKYHYYLEDESMNDGSMEDDDIFIYYDELNENEFQRGFRFYFNLPEEERIRKINYAVYDYFYTSIEERKLKLAKINEKG